MSLFRKLFEEEGLIKKAIYSRKLREAREKRVGGMWEAKVEVTTQDGKKYYFDLWHHFCWDYSPEWKPSFTHIRDHMICEAVKIGEKYYQPNNNIICVDNTYYFSKSGFSNGSDGRRDAIEQVENGTWRKPRYRVTSVNYDLTSVNFVY